MDVVHDLDSGFGLEGGIALDDSTPLPVLKAGGFGASVDAYAGETDSDSTPPRTRLWVVSLHGSQQSVNEHWGHPATLHGSSFFVVSRLRGNSKAYPTIWSTVNRSAIGAGAVTEGHATGVGVREK